MEKIIFKNINDKKLDELIDSATNNLRGNTYEGHSAPIYLAEKNRRSAEKNSKSTLSIVIVALIVSFMAMAFSVVDYFGDKSWRKEQLTVLKEIRDSNNNIQITPPPK